MRLSSTRSTQQSLQAVYEKRAGLNRHRKGLLARAPGPGDYARLPAYSVSMRDLAYLSASEHHEFALWRAKSEEILCHGTRHHCDLPEEIYEELLSGRYELVAHTHVDRGPPIASEDDRRLLSKIGQARSIIISITGEETEFGSNLFDDLQ